jgi:hypothetical protein
MPFACRQMQPQARTSLMWLASLRDVYATPHGLLDSRTAVLLLLWFWVYRRPNKALLIAAQPPQ